MINVILSINSHAMSNAKYLPKMSIEPIKELERAFVVVVVRGERFEYGGFIENVAN